MDRAYAMEPSVSYHPPEAVLEHLDWVRELARRLCRDAAVAEDVSQQAALVALRRPPRADASLRRWLAGVVRNLVRRERRSAVRRDAREERVARADRLPSTVELLEKVSVERRVVEAVLALDEPYRTTVLLRFFEGLTPQSIARRTDTPVATVKTRLRRALERLRMSLDEDFGGDGTSWLLALAPLVPTKGAMLPLAASQALSKLAPGTLTGSLTGAVTMNVKWILPITATLLAVGAWWGLRPLAEPRSEAEAPVVAAVRPVEGRAQKPEPPQSQPATTHRAQVPAVADTAPAPVEPEVAPAPSISHAVVLDLHERPVAGVHLRLFGAEEVVLSEADSDAEGRVRFESFGDHARIGVHDARYAGVMEAHVRDGSWGEVEHTLVVAPQRRVEGTVVDSAGLALEGVELVYGTSVDLRTRFDRGLHRSKLTSWSTRSDANGAFVFEGVPELFEPSLHAAKIGYRSHTEPLDEIGPLFVALALETRVPSSDLVQGRVIERGGRPVADVWVGLGEAAVATDEEGLFELSVGLEQNELVAIHPDYLPARRQRAAGELWPFVELVLEGEPLSIRGRVVRPDGSPVSDARIEIVDETPFGMLPLEEIDPNIYVEASVERVLGSGSFDYKIEGDEEGRFVVRGLLPRAYSFRVLDRESMVVQELGPVEAGESNIELVVHEDGSFGPVAGRVVSRRGEPLSGVTIALQRVLDPKDKTSQVSGQRIETDAEGHFRFPRVRREGLQLGLWGGDLTRYQYVALEDFPDPRALEVVVVASCAFLVDLGEEPGRAASFRLLDAEGESVDLSWSDGSTSFSTSQDRLVDGRSRVLMAAEGPATLVLYDTSDEEVLRLGVVLRPGELNRIDV